MEQNVSQSNKAVTESIQNNPFNHINFNPKEVNYALIVTEVLAKYGMQPIEHSITHLANYQQSNSANQNSLTSGQSMTSNIMGNTGKNGLPSGYWNDNGKYTSNSEALKQWAEQYEHMYGHNPSDPTLAQMESQIESQLEGYGVSPAQAKLMVTNFIKGAASGPYGKILNPTPGQHLSGLQYNMFEKLKTEIDDNRAGLQSGQITASNFGAKVYNPSNDMAITNAFSYYEQMNTPINSGTGTITSMATLFNKWAANGYAFSETAGSTFKNTTTALGILANNYEADQSSSSTGTSVLSQLESGAQTAATGYQQMSNDAVTDLQSDVSIMGSDDNIGQAIIKYAVQNEQTAVGNYKT